MLAYCCDALCNDTYFQLTDSLILNESYDSVFAAFTYTMIVQCKMRIAYLNQTFVLFVEFTLDSLRVVLGRISMKYGGVLYISTVESSVVVVQCSKLMYLVKPNHLIADSIAQIRRNDEFASILNQMEQNNDYIW